MAKDDRDLLDLLKFELKFLEDGGYGRSPHTPWRRPLVFEDSLTCLNFGDPAHTHPCSECLLMDFVPAELKDQVSPCRLIPLTSKGETADYFYRCGTQLELEEALAGWLRDQISRDRRTSRAGSKAGRRCPVLRRTRWTPPEAVGGTCEQSVLAGEPPSCTTMITWSRTRCMVELLRRPRKSRRARVASSRGADL